MNREQKLMLSCLRAYFNQEKTDEIDEFNAEALYKVARAHNLSGIVFSVLKDNPTLRACEKAYKAFEDDFYDNIVRYDTQRAVADEIDGILCKNGIRHIFFKGCEIREYYPVRELRVMGDIDILIEKDKRQQVLKLLTDAGFFAKNINGPVYDYIKGDVLVEMHSRLVNGKVGSKNAQEYFSDAINHAEFNGCVGHFEPVYYTAYLITHIAHHFWFYGAGVKMILDLAVVIRHFNVDSDRVLDMLEETGLDEFAKTIFTVCFNWFGAGKSYDSDTKKTEEFLLDNGAFGNINRDPSVIVRRKALEEGKKNAFSAKLSLAFPPYSKMKELPYIKFMEGRPYLLPIGWIYRIIYNFKNRKDFTKNATETLSDKKTLECAMDEINYFEEIGLI